MKTVLALLALLAVTAWAQIKCGVQPSPDTANSFQLLEDNESYRVQRFDFDKDSRVSLTQHKNDFIVIALGEGLGLSSANDGHLEKLADGDVRFLERSTTETLLHQGTTVAQAVVIALKQHWDTDVRPCAEPKSCSRPIRAGGREIGQSESLFTNGFLTAYRHRMDRGGTLSTSYYSKNGTHHLMLVALDDLHANFEGTDQELRRGQVFGSDAGEVEVEAGAHAARWVVIRVELRKD